MTRHQVLYFLMISFFIVSCGRNEDRPFLAGGKADIENLKESSTSKLEETDLNIIDFAPGNHPYSLTWKVKTGLIANYEVEHCGWQACSPVGTVVCKTSKSCTFQNLTIYSHYGTDNMVVTVTDLNNGFKELVVKNTSPTTFTSEPRHVRAVKGTSKGPWTDAK